MIRTHKCPHCKREGKLWLPYNAKKTIVTCYYCDEKEDVAYLLKEYSSIEDYEMQEYERLKKKFEPNEEEMANLLRKGNVVTVTYNEEYKITNVSFPLMEKK